MVEDRAFTAIEFLCSMAIEGLMEESQREKFVEFHASELYRGVGAFEGIDQTKRFDAIRFLLQSVHSASAVIAYGAVDLARHHRHLYASANPLDVAFRSCATGVQNWLSEKALSDLGKTDLTKDQLPCTLASFIADDGDKKDKTDLQHSFRDLRRRMRPPACQ